MARSLRNFTSVVQLPLEARSLLSSAEGQYGRKKKKDSGLGDEPKPLFASLALAIMNARAQGDDAEKLAVYSARIAELKPVVVTKLARRLEKKASPTGEKPSGIMEILSAQEPTDEELRQLEALESGGAAAKKPPAPAYVAQAEAIVDRLMNALYDVPLQGRRL